ncbi:MAG: hypothetical protein [Bacteriophage sp.]|nr:MAG: hypothetical protein [Bacteriophage sp.]
MHYYQHHIGDFIKDTANLNDHQIATYMRMLWGYYTDESPFEDDCESIAFAYRSDEKTVRLLLKHYFILGDDGWRHTRCDKEIAEYKGKAEKARASANARWKNANALPTQNERNADASNSHANQEPITNNQEKKQKTIRAPSAHALLPDVPTELVDDFVKLRKAKRASVTQTAVDGIRREANKAGYTMEQAIRTCCERGWQGFKAEWVAANNRNNNGSNHAQPKLTPAERIAVNIALNNGGEIPSGYENNGNVVAEVGRNLRPQVDGSVWNGRNGIGGADLGEGIKWVNGDAGGGRAEGLLGEF